MTFAEKLRKLDREATAGPWEEESFYGDAGGRYRALIADDEEVLSNGLSGDIRLVACLRNAVPELLAVLDAARETDNASAALKRRLDALDAKGNGELGNLCDSPRSGAARAIPEQSVDQSR